jgi:hypothetical protein
MQLTYSCFFPYVDSVHGSLHSVEVGSAVYVSEVNAVSMFKEKIE